MENSRDDEQRRLSARQSEAGYRARKRVYGGTPRNRTPMAALAPEAAKLRAAGLSVPQIAKQLDRSDRYVRMLLRHARESGDAMVFVVPDPGQEVEDPWLAGMLLENVEAFERFFVHFSGSERGYLPEHAKQWVAAALSERRILVNTPPRHAKSTILTVWFVLWLIVRDRNVQVLVISKTVDIARKFTREIAYHLSNNRELISAFGRFEPEHTDAPWRPTQGELLVAGRSRGTKSGDLTLQARGAGQQILGMEANWLIADDPATREIAESETQRANFSAWFHQDAMSRLEPNGHAIVIGQRLHLLDLYGELEAKRMTRDEFQPVWHTMKQPAVLDWETKETLWPEKWGFAELMEVYENVGSTAFECMYQQNPLPAGERLVLPEWIEGDATHPGNLDFQRSVGHGVRHVGGDQYIPVSRVISFDPSPTRYSGIIVADVPYVPGSQFQMVAVELMLEKLGIREVFQQLDRMLIQYAPVDYFIFETNIAHFFMQTPEWEDFKRRTRLIPHTTTGKAKSDPVWGIQSLAVDFEFGRVRLPFGDAESRAQSSLLTNEALVWPQGDHDDLLMALWFIKYRYRSLIPTRDLATQMTPSKHFRMNRTPAAWAPFVRDGNGR